MLAAAAADMDDPSQHVEAELVAVPPPPRPEPPDAGFHRRPLAAPAVALSSSRGREIFREALNAGTLNTFFRLSECFQTQAEPAYCGLGTLVNALNALAVDPGVLWKGVWRWYSEEHLDCCVDLDDIRKRGLTFDEWVCLAKCQGLSVIGGRAEDSSLENFRAAVTSCCTVTDAILCVAYTRKKLGQPGDGHFSPIVRVLTPPACRYPTHRHAAPICMSIGAPNPAETIPANLPCLAGRLPRGRRPGPHHGCGTLQAPAALGAAAHAVGSDAAGGQRDGAFPRLRDALPPIKDGVHRRRLWA